MRDRASLAYEITRSHHTQDRQKKGKFQENLNTKTERTRKGTEKGIYRIKERMAEHMNRVRKPKTVSERP